MESKERKSKKESGDKKPLEFPFTSERFISTWEFLRNTPKWRKKQNYALQISLNKLSRYDEEFAIEQMERAIESNWTGVVFPSTDEQYIEWKKRHGNSKNRNPQSASDRKSDVADLAELAERVLQSNQC